MGHIVGTVPDDSVWLCRVAVAGLCPYSSHPEQASTHGAGGVGVYGGVFPAIMGQLTPGSRQQSC